MIIFTIYDVSKIEGKRTQNEVPKPADVEGGHHPISPRAIYRIVVDGRQDLPDCGDGKTKCSFTYKLGWLWDVECEATLVCSKLEGEYS